MFSCVKCLKNLLFTCHVMSYIIYMCSHVMIHMSCNELHESYVQGTMRDIIIIVIAWVARVIWRHKLTLRSGCGLETRLVYCHKSLAPCNNYY